MIIQAHLILRLLHNPKYNILDCFQELFFSFQVKLFLYKIQNQLELKLIIIFLFIFLITN